MAGPAADEAHDEPRALVALLVALSYLFLCILFGGGTRQQLLADMALQLMALPVAGYALWRLPGLRADPLLRGALIAIALMVLWLALQLLPLPADSWSRLPGRGLLAAELRTAGIEAIARPISVDALASLRALFAWLPPLALGLLVLTLPAVARLRVLQAIVLCALLSLLLGMAQLAGGEHSALRWHEYTNTTQAVGPFANRNHLASLVVLSLPIAIAQLLLLARRDTHAAQHGRRSAWLIVATIALMLLLLGLAITRSRGGVLVGAVAVMLSLLLVWRRAAPPEHAAERPRARGWLALAGGVGLLFAIQYGFVGLLGRFESQGFEDARWNMATTTIAAARAFAPVGVGAGNFGAVYPSFEPTEQRGIYYVNRAHNDWLEWWLEGGAPLILIALFGVLLLLVATFAIWRSDTELRLARLGAALACWVVLVHSLLDYPLRTAAIAVVFAVLLAVVFAPEHAAQHRGHRRHRERSMGRDQDG